MTVVIFDICAWRHRSISSFARSFHAFEKFVADWEIKKKNKKKPSDLNFNQIFVKLFIEQRKKGFIRNKQFVQKHTVKTLIGTNIMNSEITERMHVWIIFFIFILNCILTFINYFNIFLTSKLTSKNINHFAFK